MPTRRHRSDVDAQTAALFAHDFNNILSVILNYTTFAIERVEDEQVLHDLEQVRIAVERGSDLTAKLLALSRVRAS